jgi:ubiquinol-cytochrome c reductase iron-sulfur subunit
VRRPERPVALALGLSTLAAAGLVVVYWRGGQPQAEGALLFVALAGLGLGLMLWAKGLMTHIPDETQARHLHRPAEPELASVADTVGAGVEEIRRRRFLSRMLMAAAGALGIAALFPIRSLGEAPGSTLESTAWRAGARLVTVDGTVMTVGSLEEDSFATVFPEDAPGSSDAQAVLIRVSPDRLQLPPDRLAGAPQGYVAYSKLCTHAGCPLGLYLAATQELRCPCHQSTFDVLRGARPVYGPAPKPLPQLPLEVDPDGTLRATGDFTEPVGPSWWDLPR